MARNKRVQDREEKQEEIIHAARALFLNEGYDATSINRIAIEVQVAPNTIYWYFKNKDELLVSILNAELTKHLNAYMLQPTQDPTERLIWVVDQLQLANRLVSTVHARLKFSTELREWHEQFHLLVEGLLRLELQKLGMANDQIETKVKIAVFTIEGLLAHQLSEQEKRAICAALVSTS
ncbi:MAG: TetR/AcrR family transcriptional regulator [Kurthia sp.]|uniref:TetR/AcrR family transcriptional regulator n=1 Tax=Acinetobacter sp. TaxID=472 RepID=UPI001B5C3D71|nr:TetR/AcrR family transcriptional regulator [Candidatus Kurthia equi]